MNGMNADAMAQAAGSTSSIANMKGAFNASLINQTLKSQDDDGGLLRTAVNNALGKGLRVDTEA